MRKGGEWGEKKFGGADSRREESYRWKGGGGVHRRSLSLSAEEKEEK